MYKFTIYFSIAAAIAITPSDSVAAGDGFDKEAQLVVSAAQKKLGSNLNDALDTYEKGIRDSLLRKYPRDPRPLAMLLEVALNRSVLNDKLKQDTNRLKSVRNLLQEVSKSPVAAKSTKEMARTRLANLDRLGKPITMQFDSLEIKDKGFKHVDVPKMAGRVVLLNFWATWCPPCVAEIEGLKNIYKTHRLAADKQTTQFDIVGISLDKDISRLERFLDELEIAWPQHYDGKGMDNAFAIEYGIHSTPTMWLIDKQGLLRDLNGRINLEKKIKLLLSEKPPATPAPSSSEKKKSDG